jgi:O-antigen/teichoic acid export membrane protein
MRGAHSAAVVGSLLQAMLTGISVMQIGFQPLVPAIANAYAHNDLSWMRKSYVHAALAVASVSVLTLAATTIAGPELMRLWLHKDLQISHTLMALAGLYFALWTWSVFHFFVLASTGRLAGAAKIYVLEGILTTAFGVVLTYFFDSEGMLAGMVVASALTTAWFLPRRTWPLLWPRTS